MYKTPYCAKIKRFINALNSQFYKMVKNKTTKCSSCSLDITNVNGSVEFNCPKCGKGKLVRCSQCRTNGIKYVCSECGFEGAN